MAAHLTPCKLPRTSSVSSTPSTPGDDNSLWDTPETPSRQSTGDDFGLSTPITPPLTPDDPEKPYEPRVKLESPLAAHHTSSTQTTSLDLDPFCEDDQSAEAGPAANAVPSGGLFGNYKDLLQATTEESSSNSQIQFNSTPLIQFCPKVKRGSGKTMKKESTSAGPNATRSNLETEVVTASKSPSNPRFKGFQGAVEHIMPSELHTRFKENPELCVASYVNNPTVRCKFKIQKQPRGNLMVLEAVSRCIQKDDFGTLPEELEKSAKMLLCLMHRKVALEQPQAKARIDELREFILNAPRESKEDNSIFKAWTMALASLSPPNPIRYSAQELSSINTPRKTNITIALNSNTISNLPGFQPYKQSRVSDMDIVKNLKKVIAKPLTPADLKSGFIYIFWDQGTFGMVKIGRTSSLERRLRDWNRCKSTHYYHKASQDGELPEVPHVQRIERLMQTELINIRKTRACDTCSKVHNEWFDMTDVKAVEVFQKWRTWILSEPYMENSEGKWVIKPEMLDAIPELCGLKPEEVQGAKNRPRPVNNRSKRPKPRRSSAMQALGASESAHTSRDVPRG